MEMLKHQIYFCCPPGWCLCSLPLISNLPFDPLDTTAQADFEDWQPAEVSSPVEPLPSILGQGELENSCVQQAVPCFAAFLQQIAALLWCHSGPKLPSFNSTWWQELCAFSDSSLKGTRQCLCIDLYWKNWRGPGSPEVQFVCGFADPSVWKHFSGCCWLSLGHPQGKEGSWWAGWSPCVAAVIS